MTNTDLPKRIAYQDHVNSRTIVGAIRKFMHIDGGVQFTYEEEGGDMITVWVPSSRVFHVIY